MMRNFLLVLFLFAGLAQTSIAANHYGNVISGDYVPQIGIPDPSDRWGVIDPLDDPVPDRPDPWTSEQAGYYYVNPSEPGATDTGRTYGYPGAARLTLPASVSPGAYVELAGTYTEQVNIAGWICTEADPCWIVGLASDRPVLNMRFRMSDMEYVLVDGLESTGGNGNGIVLPFSGHHVIFRNNHIHDRPWDGGPSAGMSMGNANAGEYMHDLIMYNNIITDLGDINSSTDQDTHGITVTSDGDFGDLGTEVAYVWVINNYCARLSGDCLQINGKNGQDSYLGTHHIYVGGNDSLNNRQAMTGIKQSSDVIVSQNRARGSFPAGGNSGGCFGHQYNKDWLWIIFNECSDAAFGIRHSSTQEETFPMRVFEIGNLIYDIKPNPNGRYLTDAERDTGWRDGSGIALTQGKALTSYLVDNTIYKAWSGMTNVHYTVETNITGNILVDPKPFPDRQISMVQAIANINSGPFSIDYNWFIDDALNEYLLAYDSLPTPETSLTPYQALSPPSCANCLENIGPAGNYFVNPTIDPATHNFCLATGSAGVDANVKSPVYDMFFDRYGIDIYVDREGRTRHATTPNMGAYECEGTPLNPGGGGGGGASDVDLRGVPAELFLEEGEVVSLTFSVDNVPSGDDLVCTASGSAGLGLTFQASGITAATWTGTVSQGSVGGGTQPVVEYFKTTNTDTDPVTGLTKSIEGPSTVADGDEFLLALNSNGPYKATSLVGDGWTLVRESAADATHTSSVYRLKQVGTTSPFPLAVTFDGAVQLSAILAQVKNLVDTGTSAPISAGPANNGDIATANSNPPEVTLNSSKNYLVFAITANDRDDAITAFPTGYNFSATENGLSVTDVQNTAGGSAGAVTVGMAAKLVSGVSSEDPSTFILAGSDEVDAYTVAFETLASAGADGAASLSPFLVTLTCDHVQGASDSNNVTVYVTTSGGNTPPVAGTVQDVSGTVGDDPVVILPVGFSDPGDVLEYYVIYGEGTNEAPDDVVVNPSTGAITINFAESFDNTIALYARDQAGAVVSATFTYTAVDPPVQSSVPKIIKYLRR